MAAKKKGRPSDYKDSFPDQARKLCCLGATDQELADFFDAPRSEAEFLSFSLALIRADRSGVIAVRKRGRSVTRRARLAASPSARVRNSVSARLWAALKGRTDGALFSRLGYSKEELVQWIEAAFKPGMSWENYGEWHIDHVKPCVEFDQLDPVQFAECWALTNLAPLWASENCKKGSAYVPA